MSIRENLTVCITLEMLVSVSYTHLDVYKRQKLMRLPPRLAMLRERRLTDEYQIEVS